MATASALAGAVRAGVDALVVIGGDGMVNLAVNAVAGTGTPLGIVAAGTGNDVARELGLPLTVVDGATAVLEAVENGGRRTVDAARCRLDGGAVRWFAGVLGAGFDAKVNERANGWRWPQGRARYSLAIARELPVFQSRPYVLDLDGQRVEARAMLVAVATARRMAGACGSARRVEHGRRHARRRRGRTALPSRAPEGLPQGLLGPHLDHPRVRVHRAACVRLDSPGIVGVRRRRAVRAPAAQLRGRAGRLTLLA